ncbi:DUF1801 domain-containing protein [Chitinimonas naiadis]
MTPFHQAAVEQVFAAYPPAIRQQLLTLRELIFDTAQAKTEVDRIEETLKWGEPAYLTPETHSGSTIRLGWKLSAPSEYAIYFHCQTRLVETFRTLFPKDFRFEGNRALRFGDQDTVSLDALRFCIAAALTYHIQPSASVRRQ